jgi:hypothetical protein
MKTQAVSRRDDLMTMLEGCLYLILVTFGALAIQLNWIALGAAVWLSGCLLMGILLLAWKRFDGGRHPCFLFLAMLTIFQGGRLIGYMFGVLNDPFQIVVQTAVPLDVSEASSAITLLLITLSAICVYLPCRWRFQPITLDASHAQKWLPVAYYLLIVTFPFLIYKNYLYFTFIRSHGGYFAVFTDSEAIVNAAGTLIRGVSYLAYNLFLIVFVLERRPRYLTPVTILFLGSSVLELLLGFRGKVFLLLITLWYVSNVKRGARFRLLPLAMSVTALSLLAVLIAGFRENSAETMLTPIAFISSQGVSIGVTEAAVEYRGIFRRHAVNYLFYSLETIYKPAAQFTEGQLFDNDLSMYLNRRAYDYGFGTGSSYLAEAYLAGGAIFTVIVSVGIGLTLRVLHVASKKTVGAVTLILMLPSMIYLPRGELLDPLASGIKSLVSVLLIFGCLYSIRGVSNLCHSASRASGRRSASGDR